jgi:hypothetical protein
LADLTLGEFTVLAIYAFILPLIMMNLLIVLMGNTYEKVQSNFKSADATALASMLYEVESL